MKRTVSDLALFGGRPLFEQSLHVGRPNVGDRIRLRQRFDDLLARRWLTNNGRYVVQLEAQLARRLDVPHCVAVCNATLGLQLVAKALDLRGEVIMPAFTFAATAHSMEWLGLTPVFADIDPETHNLDPEAARALISERTSAMLGVHLWGRACAVDQLIALGEAHRLHLFFDAAHALDCSLKSRSLCNFGACSVLSLHATKIANSFEGGAILTRSAGLAARLRLMRDHGFGGGDISQGLGINAKMSEPTAAMGITSIEALDGFITAARVGHEAYHRGLAGIPGLKMVQPRHDERSNYHYVVFEVDAEQTGIGRDTLIELLQAEGVMARRYFYPGCHRIEPYRSREPDAGRRLPATERLAARVLVLPGGAAATPEQVARVCGLVAFLIEHAGEIARRRPRA